MSSRTSQKECYRLFIDESGTASPSDHKSNIYILSGCSVDKAECQPIKIWADQIKFKYWGASNIVFHSREIGRKENHFAILKDKKVRGDFLKDVQDFLLGARFKMFFIIVDKAKARMAGWNDIKIYKDTTLSLVRNFLLILLAGDARGEIIIESATAQKDIHLLQAAGYFLGGGLVRPKVDSAVVQEALTSVSFVTKQNHDIEEQIADLFGYAAKLKYLQKQQPQMPTDDYDTMLLDALNKKIFKVPNNANQGKARFYKEVEPFLVLP